MHQTNQTLIQSLAQIRNKLSGQPVELTVLSHAATTLGQLRQQFSTSTSQMPPLITLALEGAQLLQTVKGRNNIPSVLLTTLVEALAAIEQFLIEEASPKSEALINHAVQTLQQSLQAETSKAINGSQGPNANASQDAEANAMEDLIKEFLIESYENLDQLDRDLVILEQNPSSQPTLASVFRTIHTVKGTCGFFGFTKLESVTHVGENLLSRMRDGRLLLTSDITTGLLGLVDAVRQMLNSLETERSEGDTDYSQLIELLTRLQQEQATPSGAASSAMEAAAISTEQTGIHAIESDSGLSANNAIESLEEASPRYLNEPPVSPDKQPEQALTEFARSNGDSRALNAPIIANNRIHVDVGLLDVLMNLVGELVLARNQILQYTTTQSDIALAATSQRLNLITTELQEGVMKTRMQPIGNIWSKFPRIVRDLAVACGKQIRIEMEGKETEMDKTIIEAIKDPLTHLVRNCADHGIENPDVRRANGKPAEGRIFLRAFHEGGQVNIEISDDGAGIDAEKVK